MMPSYHAPIVQNMHRKADVYVWSLSDCMAYIKCSNIRYRKKGDAVEFTVSEDSQGQVLPGNSLDRNQFLCMARGRRLPNSSAGCSSAAYINIIPWAEGGGGNGVATWTSAKQVPS